jgi:hypothetical protein
MTQNPSGWRNNISNPFQRLGRPRVHDIEADIALVRYVENQQKRTGRSINTICKYGAFVQVLSGSPEPDGPDRPTVLHEIRGATLRRRYFQAWSRLVNSGSAEGGRADSPYHSQAGPDWVTGWTSLKAAKPKG